MTDIRLFYYYADLVFDEIYLQLIKTNTFHKFEQFIKDTNEIELEMKDSLNVSPESLVYKKYLTLKKEFINFKLLVYNLISKIVVTKLDDVTSADCFEISKLIFANFIVLEILNTSGEDIDDVFNFAKSIDALIFSETSKSRRFSFPKRRAFYFEYYLAVTRFMKNHPCEPELSQFVVEFSNTLQEIYGEKKK